jgi:hypothetical protein
MMVLISRQQRVFLLMCSFFLCLVSKLKTGPAKYFIFTTVSDNDKRHSEVSFYGIYLFGRLWMTFIWLGAFSPLFTIYSLYRLDLAVEDLLVSY